MLYLVGAQLQNDIHVIWVLEEVLEIDNVIGFQGFVDFDFGGQLNIEMGDTFSLALERVKEAFSMTLTAYFLLFSCGKSS